MLWKLDEFWCSPPLTSSSHGRESNLFISCEWMVCGSGPVLYVPLTYVNILFEEYHVELLWGWWYTRALVLLHSLFMSPVNTGICVQSNHSNVTKPPLRRRSNNHHTLGAAIILKYSQFPCLIRPRSRLQFDWQPHTRPTYYDPLWRPLLTVYLSITHPATERTTGSGPININPRSYTHGMVIIIIIIIYLRVSKYLVFQRILDILCTNTLDITTTPPHLLSDGQILIDDSPLLPLLQCCIRIYLAGE